MERIKVLKAWGAALRSSRGQGLVEYALILLLVTLVVIATVRSLGTTANSTWEGINSSVANAGK
jgi:pilus assembly protein Flp/PilA